jgi:ribosomal protein L37E
MPDELVPVNDVLVTCKRCGMEKIASSRDKHLCVECANAENTRITYYRQHQEDWVAAAKEQGIDLWLQQPGETQWEYTVWTKYRDSYPGKKPSYGSVAEELRTTYNVVKKIAQRWSFPMRKQP